MYAGLGYVDWQKKFGRHVKKGAKGIKILAPCKYKVEVDEDSLSGSNNYGLGLTDTSGADAPVKRTVERLGFKVVTVFDYSMTEGKELPAIGIDELSGEVTDYKKVFDALVNISPVPVFFEDIEGGAKGYYSDIDKRIAINRGMSEAQTIKTLLHELSHARYHARDVLDPSNQLDRRHKETEAEGIAYCVGKALNIVDSADYSYVYLASWASGKETKELRNSLERIRSAADEMITDIERSFEKQAKREAKRAERSEAR